MCGNLWTPKKLLQAIAQPVEVNVFLLQPQSRTEAVVAQIVVEGVFFGGQPVQVRQQRLILAPLDGGIRTKGCSVHQERIYVTKVTTQMIQDSKAMGVYVTPVKD